MTTVGLSRIALVETTRWVVSSVIWDINTRMTLYSVIGPDVFIVHASNRFQAFSVISALSDSAIRAQSAPSATVPELVEGQRFEHFLPL